MSFAVAILLAAVVAGSWVYMVMIVVAARRWKAVPLPAPAAAAESVEAVSILKPLAGLDEGLEANLRTFFTQEYPKFEILFAVRV
ncbi:MAG TPA: ceramide glucosyltransferase, partial [Bryobacteraceae bacterium]